MPKNNLLRLNGLSENNLKNLNLEIPHNKLVVITGVSGSGKSTLAFDTIYAEGGRRYIETFSPYTRQFLDRLHRPELRSIEGVRPALALEQRNKATNSRSTVGTVTEINDYLKVIWSHLSITKCLTCDRPVKRESVSFVQSEIESKLTKAAFETLFILFPISLSGEATADSLKRTLTAEGFLRYFSTVEQKVKQLDELNSSELTQTELLVVADRIKISSKTTQAKLQSRLSQSVTQAFTYGKQRLVVAYLKKNQSFETVKYSNEPHCTSCGTFYKSPKASVFSFNSPLGACEVCRGFGKVLLLDRNLCVPNPSLSIKGGALAVWNTETTKKQLSTLKLFCNDQGIDLDQPWSKIGKRKRDSIFAGGSFKDGTTFPGVEGWFKKLERKQYKMHVRVFLSRYRGQFTCKACNGTRLKPDALAYQLNGKTLPDIWSLSVLEALEFFKKVKLEHYKSDFTETAIDEILSRLEYLVDIGLPYLTLDRQTRSLSGGESQRVNLTSILGSRLVNTMLVLDEPTIGLHTRNTQKLIGILRVLRDRGNSVVVVEHDPEVIQAADEVLDLGPSAGSEGGELVFQGPVSKLLKCKTSLTGRHLSGELKESSSIDRSVQDNPKKLFLKNARANNLKNVDVAIPLGGLVVVCGVSGTGKSTLINNCLFETYQKLQNGYSPSLLAKSKNSTVDSLTGLEFIDSIERIDQSPVGKSPRSNPATYTKAWDIIRECLAETSAAEQLGLNKSAFSFNVDGGRCPACNGAGFDRVEMQFLADVYVECDTCGGSRFQESVLNVRFGEKNVVELLNMGLTEVVELFQNHSTNDKKIAQLIERLKPLLDLGLGYLKLGQPLSKVSGGEAQRIKLAAHLANRKDSKCLFILDEPTTGLHPENVRDLVSTFNQLIELGHSILCIEHNLDIIRQADHLIELGPEGGELGGKIMMSGSPESLLKNKKLIAKSQTLMALKDYFNSTPNSSVLRLPKSKPSEKNISVIGAKFHNLKNINVEVPKNKIVAITGVSGSGKSTLAFDILFAEGQRRYIDCLSPYARQFLTQLQRADVDLVDNLPPTIAVSQKTAPPLGVATIATTTEIYQYLRLLYSKAGTQHCPEHNVAITSSSASSITDEILSRWGKKRIYLFAPAVAGRKGFYNELFNRALKAEISEARIDGKVRSLSTDLRLERHKLHWVSLLVASLSNPSSDREILEAAVGQCLLLGNGELEVAVGDKSAEPVVLSVERVCPKCKRGFRELDPQDFSFRSNRGICDRCSGRGFVGDTSRASSNTCPDCEGARIGPIGRHVYFGKKLIHQLSGLTAPKLSEFLKKCSYDKRLKPVVQPILTELTHRLDILSTVGLDYLSLDRDSHSVSGGEAQRLRLARTLGSPLTGICYVLDEPTIGLHPADHEQLMLLLAKLRDQGNTVVVVEHDEETILGSDYVIDIGPLGGRGGGKIVATGSVSDIINSSESLTGQALKQRGQSANIENLGPPKRARSTNESQELIILEGARANNLKNVNVEIPLHKLTIVAGVSGAGKSSLVHQSLYPAIIIDFDRKKKPGKGESWNWSSIQVPDSLERLIEIDQSPVGRTPTSTPASYLGIFNDIRKLFALLPDAQANGWNAGHFSFNTGNGRCEMCSGRGYLRIPMSFLPDATLDCERCSGLRYEESTLELKYQGISIGALLLQTMDEAMETLKNHRKIRRSLEYVNQLGLGYLTLGQPTHTLSGGEAQRLKIARELGARDAVNTLYVLDEPTTGLHMVDVDKLLNVLELLIEQGNTVVVIEHNLDVIRRADHIIEMGPGPGAKGGKVIFSGSPAKLLKVRKQTPTSRFMAPRTSEVPSRRLANEA